jgi:hypothetical protein
MGFAESGFNRQVSLKGLVQGLGYDTSISNYCTLVLIRKRQYKFIAPSRLSLYKIRYLLIDTTFTKSILAGQFLKSAKAQFFLHTNIDIATIPKELYKTQCKKA